LLLRQTGLPTRINKGPHKARNCLGIFKTVLYLNVIGFEAKLGEQVSADGGHLPGFLLGCRRPTPTAGPSLEDT
jgi:hypothetical protein